MNNELKDFILSDIAPRRRRAYNVMLSLQYKMEGLEGSKDFGMKIGKMIDLAGEVRFAEGEFEALDDLYYESVERYNHVQVAVYGDKGDSIVIETFEKMRERR